MNYTNSITQQTDRQTKILTQMKLGREGFNSAMSFHFFFCCQQIVLVFVLFLSFHIAQKKRITSRIFLPVASSPSHFSFDRIIREEKKKKRSSKQLCQAAFGGFDPFFCLSFVFPTSTRMLSSDRETTNGHPHPPHPPPPPVGVSPGTHITKVTVHSTVRNLHSHNESPAHVAVTDRTPLLLEPTPTHADTVDAFHSSGAWSSMYRQFQIILFLAGPITLAYILESTLGALSSVTQRLMSSITSNPSLCFDPFSFVVCVCVCVCDVYLYCGWSVLPWTLSGVLIGHLQEKQALEAYGLANMLFSALANSGPQTIQ